MSSVSLSTVAWTTMVLTLFVSVVVVGLWVVEIGKSYTPQHDSARKETPQKKPVTRTLSLDPRGTLVAWNPELRDFDRVVTRAPVATDKRPFWDASSVMFPDWGYWDPQWWVEFPTHAKGGMFVSGSLAQERAQCNDSASVEWLASFDVEDPVAVGKDPLHLLLWDSRRNLTFVLEWGRPEPSIRLFQGQKAWIDVIPSHVRTQPLAQWDSSTFVISALALRGLVLYRDGWTVRIGKRADPRSQLGWTPEPEGPRGAGH